MSRQQTRRIEAQIRKLIESNGDNCSLCRAPFQHNHRSYGGTTSNGKAAIVGDCCVERLASIYTTGIFVTRDYGMVEAKNADDVRLSPEAIEINIALLQQAVAEADAISKKAGIAVKMPLPDWRPRPWKTDDANWFKDNPSRTHRIRASFPNEPHCHNPPANHVPLMLIRQVEPGARVKIGLLIHRELTPVPDSDPLLRAIFDVAAASIPVSEWTPISRDNKIKKLTQQYLAAEQTTPS